MAEIALALCIFGTALSAYNILLTLALQRKSTEQKILQETLEQLLLRIRLGRKR